MNDLLLAIAEIWDAEPECRCTDTDRGVDTVGCEPHGENDE